MVIVMEKIKNIFLGLCFLFLLLFIAYVFLGPLSKISFVDLEVEPRLKAIQSYQTKEDKIVYFLNSHKGQFLWGLDLKKLTKQIHDFYIGMDVHVSRKLPNRLVVSLKQKRAVLLLLKEGKWFFSISSEGEIGAKKQVGESLDFPVLRGDSFWKKPELRRRVLALVSLLPLSGSPFSVQNISEISYNQANDSLFFYLIPGRFILELNDQLFQKKINNINFVLRYLNQEENPGGLIDARMDKKIIVKKLN